MAEVAPSGGGGGNRNFLLIIGGLGALLVIAMLALGAIFVLPGLLGQPQSLAVVPSPTRIVIPNTPTRTPQASPTLVLVAQNTVAATVTETPAPLMTATAIPITATPIMITATPEATVAAGSQLPDSGLGEDLLLLFGGGILLLGVIVVVRRMRST
jgi:hypothetical protein